MQWIAFRLHHACPFARLSERHPTVPITNWCNYRVEVLEYATPDPAVRDLVQRDLETMARDGFRVLHTADPDGRARTVLMKCGHEKGQSVDDIIEAHGGLLLYPVLYRAGWEHYRMVMLEEDRMDALFKALAREGTIEVTAKRSMDEELLSRSFVVSVNDLMQDLTGKQAAALKAAIEHGYYQVPRRIRFEDIAKARHVPRTTFEEHVRKAESKLINALAPYVAMHADQLHGGPSA